jgi:hypothetical protein
MECRGVYLDIRDRGTAGGDGAGEKSYKMSVRRRDGERQFANLGRKWEDNATFRKEIGCEGVN